MDIQIQEKHTINCDATAFIPDRWTVAEHQKAGQFEWDPERIQLYLNKSQQNYGYPSGKKLWKELRSKQVLNANVLDYLLKNPYLIPEEWKKHTKTIEDWSAINHILFWGTIYRDSQSRLCVRSLSFFGKPWPGSFHLNDEYNQFQFAAILRNSKYSK